MQWFAGNRPYTLDRVVRILLGVASVLVMVVVLGYLRDVLVPFAVAALLAYLLHPVVVLWQRALPRRSPPIVAILLALFTMGLAVYLLVLVLTPLVSDEIHKAAITLTGLLEDPASRAKLKEMVPVWVLEYVEKLATREEIDAFVSSPAFTDWLFALMRQYSPGVVSLFNTAASLLIGLMVVFVVMLYMVFILMDYDKVMHGWQDKLPLRYRGPIIALVYDFRDYMRTYFRAQALIAMLVAVEYSVAFTIIGLPLGILLGIFIGILTLVPYLQFVGFVPALALAFVQSLETGQNFGFIVLLIGASFFVFQFIQETIVYPRIMGKAFGFNPAVMLLSLSIFGKLLGVLGMIVALPVTFLLWSYYQKFVLAPVEDDYELSQGSDNHPSSNTAAQPLPPPQP